LFFKQAQPNSANLNFLAPFMIFIPAVVIAGLLHFHRMVVMAATGTEEQQENNKNQPSHFHGTTKVKYYS
jgi:hypothetical protein